MTNRADGFAAITTHHYAVLYLILVVFHHFEEGIYANGIGMMLIRRKAVPQHILIFLAQSVVRFEDGKFIFCGTAAEFVFPHAHFLAMPALHAAFVNAERSVWNNQFLVDAHHFSEAFTFGAST